MNTEIVPFGIESYDDVLALWQQCKGVGLSCADSRENVQTYLDRNPGMSFVAMADGKVVGAILAGHDGRRGYMYHLAVHPDRRRQRIGRRLVARCLAVLADSGIQKCHVFIYTDNTDGVMFWKSLGWASRSDIGVISRSIEAATGADCWMPAFGTMAAYCQLGVGGVLGLAPFTCFGGKVRDVDRHTRFITPENLDTAS